MCSRFFQMFLCTLHTIPCQLFVVELLWIMCALVHDDPDHSHTLLLWSVLPSWTLFWSHTLAETENLFRRSTGLVSLDRFVFVFPVLFTTFLTCNSSTAVKIQHFYVLCLNAISLHVLYSGICTTCISLCFCFRIFNAFIVTQREQRKSCPSRTKGTYIFNLLNFTYSLNGSCIFNDSLSPTDMATVILKLLFWWLYWEADACFW